MNFIRPPTRGAVDETLSFFVASFQLSEVAMSTLPTWIRPFIPVFHYGGILTKEEGSDRTERSRYTTLETAASADFLGSHDHPLERVSALGLEESLALLGYMPSHFSLYVKRVRQGNPVYRLNIFWNRPPLDPTEETFERVRNCLELFRQLQVQYAWSATGTEFRNLKKGYRCIVLNFRAREPVIPSLRYGVVGIKGTQVTAW